MTGIKIMEIYLRLNSVPSFSLAVIFRKLKAIIYILLSIFSKISSCDDSFIGRDHHLRIILIFASCKI